MSTHKSRKKSQLGKFSLKQISRIFFLLAMLTNWVHIEILASKIFKSYPLDKEFSFNKMSSAASTHVTSSKQMSIGVH